LFYTNVQHGQNVQVSVHVNVHVDRLSRWMSRCQCPTLFKVVT